MSRFKEIIERVEAIKAEVICTAIIFITLIIIFKLLFFKEPIISVLRVVFAVFWAFVLPGYFIMLYWRESLQYFERLLLGTCLAAGILGILSYYFGLLGLDVNFHYIWLPLLLDALGICLFYLHISLSKIRQEQAQQPLQ